MARRARKQTAFQAARNGVDKAPNFLMKKIGRRILAVASAEMLIDCFRVIRALLHSGCLPRVDSFVPADCYG
jgi:hypothetical protein